MSQLKLLRVNNFQRIKSLEVPFGSVTAIVGESEVGKSCAFRGLESLILNAKGNKFIRKGASSCSVYAETDKGSVEWVKKKTGSATYNVVLGDRKETFTKAEALPALAKEVLGLSEVEFGDTKLMVNLQGQFVPPFLLFESGTTVAKVLGKFTKLDEIYAAIRVANKDLLNIRQELSVREKDLESSEERVKRHEGLDKLGSVLSVLKKMAGSLKGKEEAKDELEESVDELDGIRSEIGKINITGVIGLVDEWPDVALSEKVNQIQQLGEQVEEVDRLRAELGKYDEGLVLSGRVHDKALKELEEFKVKNKICPACGSSW
jgi:hypothetical protein